MPKTAQNSHFGFTFIELLVVIAIIGILGSVVAVSFTASQKRARDTTRKSDLAQFRSSLESYANKNNGLYPVHTTVIAANTLCGASDLNLAFTCPTDPKAGTAPYGYKYVSDAGGTNYALYEALELPSPAANIYFGLCSNGTTLSQAAVPTIASCP